MAVGTVGMKFASPFADLLPRTRHREGAGGRKARGWACPDSWQYITDHPSTKAEPSEQPSPTQVPAASAFSALWVREGSDELAGSRSKRPSATNQSPDHYGLISTRVPFGTTRQISSISAFVTAMHPNVQSRSTCALPIAAIPFGSP